MERYRFSRKIIYIGRSKSGEKREIPMNEGVFKALIALDKHPKTDYVFHKKDGQPYKDLRESFKKACRKAGIEDFRWHDLRHTFASHLVMSGVNLKTVQELMGYKTYGMTLRYAHLSPSHKRRMINRISLGVVTSWSQTSL